MVVFKCRIGIWGFSALGLDCMGIVCAFPSLCRVFHLIEKVSLDNVEKNGAAYRLG
ncbi:hypothetical protein QOZ95_000964 [Paenibacillus brasilensis]|uniref:Uncharacterized protein n=1 Tax=Paenibacillus brasilensis TaxID=128574 RepID=A0ABU0KTR4_9BACL|nr:hypothetical protein [Paenibacillus brasilensis]